VDLPLSKPNLLQGILIRLELWNSFSETVLEGMPDLKPKKLFHPRDIPPTARLAIYVRRFNSLSISLWLHDTHLKRFPISLDCFTPTSHLTFHQAKETLSAHIAHGNMLPSAIKI